MRLLDANTGSTARLPETDQTLEDLQEPAALICKNERSVVRAIVFD